MRSLNDREKRTVRIAVAFLLIYFPIFVGPTVWRWMRSIEEERDGLQLRITQLETELQREIGRERRAARVRSELRVDLAALDRETLISEARAAVRDAAKKSGVGLGPSRETPAGSRSRELAVVHLEGAGPVGSVVKFLHALPRIGYPLTIERVTVSADPKKPGQAKFRMSVTLLDVGAWKTKEKPVA